MKALLSDNHPAALLRHPAAYCVLGGALAFLPGFSSSWPGAAILAGLICVYGFYVYVAAKNNQIDMVDQREAGDNCYLIGFVYTLAVIIATIVNLATTGDSAQPGTDAVQASADAAQLKIESLLGTVGIALSTSAVGMIWRFVLLQGTRPPDDELEKHISKVAQSSHQLSAAVREISGAAVEFKGEADSTSKAMAEYAAKIRGHADNITQEVSNPFLTLLDNLSGRIDDVFHKHLFTDIKGQLDSIIGSQETMLAAIEKRLGESTAALKSSADAATKIAEEVERQLSAVVAAQEKTLALIQQRLDKSTRALESGAETASESGEEIRKSLAELDDLRSKLESAVASQKQALEQIREQSSNLAGAMVTELHAVGEIYEGAEQQLRQKYREVSEKATRDLYDELINGANRAMSGLEKGNSPEGDKK